MRSSIAEEVYGTDGHDGSALHSFSTLKEVFLDQCGFHVRDYRWDRPRQDAWSASFHLLDFSLTPRPRPAWAIMLDRKPRLRRPLGRVIFVPAGAQVLSGTAGGKQRSLTCFLAPHLLDRLLARSPCWDAAALDEGLHLNSTMIDRLLLSIQQELQKPGFATEVVLESMANTLAVALIRYFALDRNQASAIRSGGLAPWRLRLIQDRARAEAAPPGLVELAALCGLSVRHLTRAFKAETGTTIAAFVQQATITRAQSLLSTTGSTVGEVAATLGFSSAASFCYAFRRATGQRPSEARASVDMKCR